MLLRISSKAFVYKSGSHKVGNYDVEVLAEKGTKLLRCTSFTLHLLGDF